MKVSQQEFDASVTGTRALADGFIVHLKNPQESLEQIPPAR
jgi:hypothetical protein